VVTCKINMAAKTVWLACFLLALSLCLARGYENPCDPLQPVYCGLPFPNSYYTAPDPSTATGLRVNFSLDTFPVDIIERKLDPAEWNTLGTIDLLISGPYIYITNYHVPLGYEVQIKHVAQ